MYTIIPDIPVMRRKVITCVIDPIGEVAFSCKTMAAGLRWLIDQGEEAALLVDEVGAILLSFKPDPE